MTLADAWRRISGFERFGVRQDGAAYLHRWRVLALPGGRRIYLHRILLSDHARHLHDHPKAFWSVGLAGGYVEILIGGARRSWRAPWIRRFGAEHVHRIELLPGQTCWTLVLAGRRVRGWGFYVPDIWLRDDPAGGIVRVDGSTVRIEAWRYFRMQRQQAWRLRFDRPGMELVAGRDGLFRIAHRMDGNAHRGGGGA